MEIEETRLQEHKRSNQVLGLAWMLLVVIFVAFTESDYFKSHVTSQDIPALLTNCLFGLGLLIWLIEDAKKVDYSLSIVTKIFALVLPQITIFVYCFASRGFKDGMLKALKAVCFGGICFVVLLITVLLFDN